MSAVLLWRCVQYQSDPVGQNHNRLGRSSLMTSRRWERCMQTARHKREMKVLDRRRYRNRIFALSRMRSGLDGEPHPVLYTAYSAEDRVTSACRGHCVMCFQLDPSDCLRVQSYRTFHIWVCIPRQNVARKYTTWALNGSSKLFRA